MLNGFKNFIPDFLQLLPLISSLLRKDSAFLWSEECNREFTEIKKVISGPLGLKPIVPRWHTQLWVNFLGLGIGLVLTQTNPKDQGYR